MEKEREETRKRAKKEEGGGEGREERGKEDVHCEEMLLAASFTTYEMGASHTTLSEVYKYGKIGICCTQGDSV